ncbi:MAG TPA: beta-ketoacyl-ACP synthase II [Dissulfurispiraceae bacterium]
MRRVVITGIGAVTPLACSFNLSWDLIKNGISGIKEITGFDASGLPWKSAGELHGFDPLAYMSAKEVLRLDPFVHYALASAAMAAGDAGHSSLSNAGVIIGSSRGGISTLERALLQPSRLSPHLMPSTTISMAASFVAQKLGIKGNCLGISNACASGTNAVGEAFRLIRHGISDLMLAGGTDAPLCRLCVEGYGVSGALSTLQGVSASRPFDRSRRGFVIAEGAAVLVLEEYMYALKRGATIYAEIVGYGNTTDAFHITQPYPAGESEAIGRALKDAGINPGDVNYLNAHGTSTPLGDRAEAEAIRRVFKDTYPGLPVSAAKSMTGHMLAASGAFEAACTAASIREGIIPPTINLTAKDPDCDINIVTEKMELPLEVAVTNSFGFGGLNAVLVMRKC